MKQVLQNVATGEVNIADVPCPQPRAGYLRIATRVSLISAGTERMMVEFGKAGWLQKARQQPDKVRTVLDKLRTDGLLATVDAVRSKLDQPLAPGYCNVGVVIDVGEGVSGFAPGDRVLSNGKHAEVVSVPRNLCARIPDEVGDEQAAFAVLAAIGLQGIRLAQPTLGECVAVTGLGLIGLLTVQLLRAQGCRVLGIDFDPARLELARRWGAETVNLSAGADPLAAAERFSRGRGIDAVLLTAATRSSDPVSQAARMCRKRGRIVLVGVTGLELSRADFYEKELTFQVSCSYGPGRYDPEYEENGRDYPVGFVRWTEQRNFEAVLDLMAAGALDLEPLLSHRFPVTRADEAYALLGSHEPSLGILIEYPQTDRAARLVSRVDLVPRAGVGAVSHADLPRLGVIGAGNYASRVLMPALRAAGGVLDTVVSASGVSAVHHGRRHGFTRATSSASELLDDPAIDAVVIATRHDQHAGQVLAALRAGKSVFVEKPLCLRLDELDAIGAMLAAPAAGGAAPLLMVGFNRRFAPLVVEMKSRIAALDAPRALQIQVNAGAIPADHWIQNRAVGGGRIVGEACHFIDLARHLVGHRIETMDVRVLDGGCRDSAVLLLRHVDGSLSTISYLANGHKALPKERIEIYCAGRAMQLDNFRVLRQWGWPGRSRHALWGQDKGQRACVAAFVAALRSGGPPPIPLDEILEVSRLAIEAQP